MLPTQTHAYIETHWYTHLERTRTFLRQPSISAQNVGLLETANLLRGWLEERGATVQYFGKPDKPIVYAEWNVGAPKTLLVYGMYDVQPVDNQTWTTPPFAADIWKHPEGGESIVARGACNSKGPLMAFLHAIESLCATGGLPVNIKWTIEGEEEIGSPELPGFYATHKAMLQADAAYEPFWSQGNPNATPHLCLGTKGIVGIDFICRSGDWGGPKEVIHSSLGVWSASPAWRLVQALNSMVDASQELSVEGIPPFGTMTADDEVLLDKLATTFDEAAVKAHLGMARFRREVPPKEQLRLLNFAPMLNINGLHAGYAGEGTHTIVPTEARALCDLRLPPGVAVKSALDAIRAHLAKRGYGDIEMITEEGYPAALTPFNAPVAQALLQTFRAHGVEPIVQPVEASASPFYLYTDVLGLNFVFGGLGAASGSHGPDEWCSVQGLKNLEKSVATFLTTFAKI